MSRRLFRSDSRGVAAVEFALIAPVFVTMLVILVDVGRFIYYRTVIIGAVSAGVQFAVLAAQNGTAIDTAFSTEAALVTSQLSQNVLTAPDAYVTATVNNGASSSQVCCITTSGTTTTWTCAAAPTCSIDGSDPGVYITIVASATFHPLLSSDTTLLGKVMKSTIIERLK